MLATNLFLLALTAPAVHPPPAPALIADQHRAPIRSVTGTAC